MTEFRYDPKSLRADEFINDAEILDSIAYADAHKGDIELCAAFWTRHVPTCILLPIMVRL